MTLYVVTLDDPPAGEDFTFTVPGNYLYDVTGITATLDTSGGATPTAVDSSGNGNDGTYGQNGTPPVPRNITPGLVVGNAALHAAASVFGGSYHVDIPHAIYDTSQDFTVGWWMQSGLTLSNQEFVCWSAAYGGNTLIASHFGPGFQDLFRIRTNGFVVDWRTAPGSMPADGLPHFYLLTYNQGSGTPTFYIDGTAVAFTITSGPFPNAASTAFRIGGIPTENILDELFTVDGELGPTDAALFYAAGQAGFVTWDALVMADVPVAFYHLDDGVSSTGRQPSLVVTNATTDLEVIPTGFPAVATPGPYGYAWQPNLNADTQSTDGTLTTVAIPELILPAGYTVGTRTLDLQSTDQWSKVTLWWDDRYQTAFDPFAQYEFPGGIRLRYHRQGT